jgi:hypothetical protein
LPLNFRFLSNCQLSTSMWMFNWIYYA